MAQLMPDVLGNNNLINNLLQGVGVLVSILPQLLQNGGGNLGVLPSPVPPPFLGGPGHGVFPWGNRTVNGTNQFEDVPNTGVTRYYDLTISRGTIAPDGYEKPALLINGQFPGPTLEANWGDFFQITVHNNISGPEEGTALHWHGLTQKGTPYADGVPRVQQCPIAPGTSLTYVFQADLYGSSWYHSHYSAQYAGGLLGGMVIHGPQHVPYDVDLGPIFVQDYFHRDYYEIVKDVAGPNPVISLLTTSDNTLIQGKMVYDCSQVKDGRKCTDNAGLAKFDFQPGKTHLLRFINPGAASHVLISIDHHDMTVIAQDFIPVKPYTVDTVMLGVGQRVDVLVKAKPSIPTLNGAYWMRARQPVLCALSYQPFALAAIYYKGAKTNAKPLSLPHASFITPTLINCANEPLSVTEPVYKIAPPPPQTTQMISITQTINSTGNVLYEMNRQTFRGNYNHPVLGLAAEGNVSYPNDPQWNVYNFGRNETIRLIFQNNVPFSHPMHVHGQNMYIVDEGTGSWDGKTAIRPSSPMRRDTQILKPNGYLVVDLHSDNPGVWPFHCHIAWHVSGGLYINVMQKPDEIPNNPETLRFVEESCVPWDAWSEENISEQIDSGLRKGKERLVKEKRFPHYL